MRRLVACSILLGSLAAVGWSAPPGNNDPKPAQAEASPKPKFPVGKETTYVTGPCDEDGYIDYAAALHERLSQGITPGGGQTAAMLFRFASTCQRLGAVGIPARRAATLAHHAGRAPRRPPA